MQGDAGCKDLHGVQGFARCAAVCKGIESARGRIVCKGIARMFKCNARCTGELKDRQSYYKKTQGVQGDVGCERGCRVSKVCSVYG